MRTSRSTEFVNDFPEHVVTAWMGHSKKIAQKHYLQVTEEDYKQASSNPTQQITVSPRRVSQPILSAHEKTLVLQGLAIIRETLQTREVGDEGLELLPFSAGSRAICVERDAESDAYLHEKVVVEQFKLLQPLFSSNLKQALISELVGSLVER